MKMKKIEPRDGASPKFYIDPPLQRTSIPEISTVY